MKRSLLSFIILSCATLLKAQDFNIEFRSQVTWPYSGASCWAYVDASGNEYGLMGTNEGISIVDVTNPDSPVLLFDVDHVGAHGLWREIKVWENYAYATNETDNGVLIVDLSDLPNSYQKYQFVYQDGNKKQQTGHTLWIDEKGRLFVFGGDFAQGYTCFDLTVDPLNPPFLGEYKTNYIHDGFVRGDTLWAAEIYAGNLEILDVSDPANPVSMATVTTPGEFTHNVWPTSDNKYAFTTDEVSDSYCTAYDVSDLGNITEIDREQSSPGTDVIIHNVHLYNDQFLTTAYYRDGVIIFDVSRPDNIVIVGRYDTYPQGTGSGFQGCWAVYPWLPSGNILASDIEGELYVLRPSYVAACWLEGFVTDSITGAPLNGVNVEILTTGTSDLTDLTGEYKTGYGIPGTYTIRYSKVGYYTKEISLTMNSGVVNTLNIELAPFVAFTLTGQVLDSATLAPVEGASLLFLGQSGNSLTATSDAAGNFSILCYEDTYDAFAGKWGKHEDGILNTGFDQSTPPLVFKLRNGYYDDFILDLGWTITGNAETGLWERAEPVGTQDLGIYYNPEYDLTGDWGDYCFSTGNGGGGIFDDDVDDGKTTITSPLMDLSNYADPVLKFYAWFANFGGAGTPNDTLRIFVSNAVDNVEAFKIHKNSGPQNQWVYYEVHLNEYMAPGPDMQVKFQAGDLSATGHGVEAAIDYVRIDDALATGTIEKALSGVQLTSHPNPFSAANTIHYNTKNVSEPVFLVITNLVGQTMYRQRLSQPSGDLTWGYEAVPGMYLVSLVTEQHQMLAGMRVVRSE